MKRCVIVAGGERAPIAPLREGDFLLACDRGLVYALEEGLRPDLILGDFDSYTGALPADIPVLRYPVEKDDTDGMLAVRWAAENGFEAVALRCMFGGRLDHLLSNIQTLHYAAELGMEAEARDENTFIRILRPGAYEIPERPGWSLSLLSLSERVEGLTIRGTKYEAEGVTLLNPSTLGQSNAFRGDAHIRFARGVLALVSCRMED